MRVNEAIFAPGFKCEPYWWDAAPRPRRPPEPLPDEADIAIVGSGYTGLSAALTLARAGRAITVIEAGDPGCGASSRNAGFVGKTLKHSLAKLMNEGGTRRAVAVWNEVFRAFDYVTGLIEEQRIDCHFVRCGRFMGASSPRHYETLARELELRRKHLGQESEMVPKAEQHREIGSGIYHGGAVIPDLGALHPGLYHLGLLDRVRDDRGPSP